MGLSDTWELITQGWEMSVRANWDGGDVSGVARFSGRVGYGTLIPDLPSVAIIDNLCREILPDAFGLAAGSSACGMGGLTGGRL